LYWLLLQNICNVSWSNSDMGSDMFVVG
jgi:hypothetical protein